MIPFNAIAQFGVAGLAVFLFYVLSAKYIHSNTRAIDRLSDLIAELATLIKQLRR